MILFLNERAVIKGEEVVRRILVLRRLVMLTLDLENRDSAA